MRSIILAVTDTAADLGGIPKTGIPFVDKWIGVVFALLFAATALATYFAMVVTSLKAALAKARDAVGTLVTTAKAMTWGIEASTEDIEAILVEWGIERQRAKLLAKAIHNKITGNIQNVATTAKVEPILNPIVKETKSEMKTYKEEAGRANIVVLAIIALVALIAFVACTSVAGCATAPKDYVEADAAYYSITKPILIEVEKRQPKEHAARAQRLREAKEFQIRQAGGTIPEAPTAPADFFDGVFAAPAPAAPEKGVIR